jgi:hemoglobin
MNEMADALDEASIRRIVEVFYESAVDDSIIGPVLQQRIRDWDSHRARMETFFSSIAGVSDRYQGQFRVAHTALDLDPVHFKRWLSLFERAVRSVCTAGEGERLIRRIRDIAAGLEESMAIYRAGKF